MITINLKPGSKRAAAGASLAGGMSALRSMRSRVKDPWPMTALVVVAVTAIALAYLGFSSGSKVSSLEDQLATARAENRRFKTFQTEKKRAEAAKDSVVQQIATIRSVDGDRYVWPHVLDEVTREIPPAWYEDDYDALLRLLEHLHQRRRRVPDLILEAKRSNRQPFPNWM